MDNNSLAHTKWNCKYHIVFTPKYRRQVIYKQISADIGQIIRKLFAICHAFGRKSCCAATTFSFEFALVIQISYAFKGTGVKSVTEKAPKSTWIWGLLEQDTGVEPAFTAWEAVVLPIYEPCTA